VNAVLEPSSLSATDSPLARARLHRQMTIEEAAKRAGIPVDEAHWLEDGRVYRFASADQALVSMLLYATGLGIDHHEALAVAGRPVPPRALRSNPWPRLGVLLAIAGALVALVAALVLARERHAPSPVAQLPGPTLPAPWTIKVVVLNGSGNINETRRVASSIGALGYSIVHVGRAGRFDYQQTTVYFPPGAREIALRLAKQLGEQISPLPGGNNPRRLVTIVGPRRGPTQ
jgi:hypothetical protein